MKKEEPWIKLIRKRDGTVTDFCKEKITNAIFKAAKAVGGDDKQEAERIADSVVAALEDQHGPSHIPSVEEVQDAVEKALMKAGHAKTAKAYILYRQKRNEARQAGSFFKKISDIVDGYTSKEDWRVKENSNTDYSFSGLQAHISGAIIAEYTLNHIYPKEISEAHRNTDIHIHDLSHGTFAGYCAGWSLRQILTEGFNGAPGKIAAKPARHFNAALGQIVNFLGTLQNEWAGAQALSSFDTYLAPFIRNDKLNQKQVNQGMQEFIFAINQTSRWGNQVPFTNLTIDWTVPEDMKEQNAVHGGKLLDEQYCGFQKEMDMINKAFIEIMMEGDMNGRIFTFPIPTYNITKGFDWESENAELLFEMTSKYGTPYFQNFINSSLRPEDVRSMCCRLQLNIKELRMRTGGLFGSGEQTGSIGVVTVNMSKTGYLSKTKKEFLERLEYLMTLAKNSLEIKRKEVQKSIDNGLLPYTKRYLGHLNNHFSTIGLCGMNEACLNFLGEDITTKNGKALALEALDFMRERLQDFQKETGKIYNLEATPAEGTSYRLAKHDKKNYPNIITAGTKETPYYTNSTHLPASHIADIFSALKHQDELQSKYTGGTVFHGFLGERIANWKSTGNLIKKIAHNFKLPYFTITPTFSICPVHGYLKGEHFGCPREHTEEETEKYGVEMNY